MSKFAPYGIEYCIQDLLQEKPAGPWGARHRLLFLNLIQHPIAVHDAKFTVHSSPVSEGLRPSSGNLHCRQVQRLHQGCRAWKYASLAVQLLVGAVDTFDGVRGVNHLPDLHGELENRANGIPVIVPAVH